MWTVLDKALPMPSKPREDFCVHDKEMSAKTLQHVEHSRSAASPFCKNRAKLKLSWDNKNFRGSFKPCSHPLNTT